MCGSSGHESCESQFDQLPLHEWEESRNGGAYDIGSVMHYGKNLTFRFPIASVLDEIKINCKCSKIGRMILHNFQKRNLSNIEALFVIIENYSHKGRIFHVFRFRVQKFSRKNFRKSCFWTDSCMLNIFKVISLQKRSSRK